MHQALKKSTNGHKPPAGDLVRCVIYRRVSSEAQGERVSPEVQLAECEAHAHAHGYSVVAVYGDTERYRSRGRLVEPSGTRIDRPGFQQMLADGAAGKFDTLIAWKEDRLYRGVRPAMLIDDLLESASVTVELVRETFDRKMLFIKAGIGKIELDSIRERTHMGHRERVRSGLIHGGPVPGGYTPIAGDHGAAVGYTLDPDWRGFFDDLARLFIGRASFAEIARRLGPDARSGRAWYQTTLSYMLRNPFYRGQVAYGWQSGQPEFTVPARHEPAWDAETIAAIDRELARRGGRHNAPRGRALLSGIVRCGYCGHELAAQMSQGRYRYYGCHRPVMVRTGAWPGRRTHAPNYIAERKLVLLVRAQCADMSVDMVDEFLQAMAIALGGPAPADAERQARLEAECNRLLARLADLTVGLDGVRNASPAATEAILAAITSTGRQLDTARAEKASLVAARRNVPDLAQVRAAMLRLIREPELFALPAGQLQPILRAALPALYVAGGAIVAPVAEWGAG